MSEETTVIGTEQAEQQTQPQAGESAAAGIAAPGEQQPQAPVTPKSFTQEEVNAIVEKRLAKERRRMERESRPPVQQPEHKPSPDGGTRQDDDPKPRQDQFQNYDDYVEALGAWSGRKGYAAEQAKQEKKGREQRAEQARQSFETGVDQIRRQGMAKFEDFEEVAMNESVPITDHMLSGLIGSDVAADVLHYLGKHPEEAKQIATMNPWAQARAMGRLESKLSEAPKPAASQAPAPVKPVGSTQSTEPDPHKLEGDEYAKYRRERKAKFGR